MFWDAYLADTTHLTTEEHGAYLLLLAAMWRRNGSVPDDDRDNARIVGMTPAKWRRMKARLSSLLIVDNGEITQKNLRKTWEITQEKIRKNRANGAKGGRPVSSKTNNLAKANGFVSDNPNETIPEPEPEPYKIYSEPSLKSGEENDGNTTEANPLDTGQSEDWPAATTPANSTAENGRGAHGGDSRQNGSAASQPACPSATNGSLPPLPSPADYSGLADDTRRRATDFVLRQSGVTRHSPTPEGDAFRIAFDRRRAKTLE